MAKTFTKIIVRRNEPLSDDAITSILRGTHNAPWNLALTQIIDASRQEYIERSSAGADRNNSHSMARDLGAHEALTALLIKLAELSGT